MKKPILAVVAMLLAAACNDEQKKPGVPTAPGPMPVPAMSATADLSQLKGSTVCLSYARDKALVVAELKEKPESARAQKRLERLETLIKDACP